MMMMMMRVLVIAQMLQDIRKQQEQEITLQLKYGIVARSRRLKLLSN